MSECTAVPSRRRPLGCGRTPMKTYRSPGSPPRRPALPSPRTRSRLPSSTPARPPQRVRFFAGTAPVRRSGRCVPARPLPPALTGAAARRQTSTVPPYARTGGRLGSSAPGARPAARAARCAWTCARARRRRTSCRAWTSRPRPRTRGTPTPAGPRPPHHTIPHARRTTTLAIIHKDSRWHGACGPRQQCPTQLPDQTPACFPARLLLRRQREDCAAAG